MGISGERLRVGLDALASVEPAIAAAIARAGYPEPRIRPRGYTTLLRTIIGQQVSIKAAESIWNKLAGVVGDIDSPAAAMACSDEDIRSAGLSRQKLSYLRSLAGAVVSGTVDFANLPADDEDAIKTLMEIKGIGRWSAEIYLLFADGRADIWPAGDLAVQIEVGRVMGLDAKPSEKMTREIAEAWRPHRGAAAILMWHHYKTEVI